ncbi:MAG: NAD-dependent epimerase/dehydratase family protein, partial [Rhodospirillales bacterium]
VSNFIVQALKGDAITVYGDGQQTRSFCFVDDLINGLVGLMNAPDDITGPMNLGNPHEISIVTLAEKIIDLTKSKSTLIRKPLPEDDPMQRCPDIGFAKKTLDWQPSVALEDGLKRTIAYFKNMI